MTPRKLPIRTVGSACLALLILSATALPVLSVQTNAASNNTAIQTATLEMCIETALENNHRRPASRYAVEMAEARHRQALAGYWPQINLQGGYQLMDEYPDFMFPGLEMDIPMGGSIPVTIPGVGTVPVSSISIPGQEVKLMDNETYKAGLDITWLLYDGGMRKGYREQASNLIEVMEQESRRTDLEIVDSVKRLYYGTVLATRLHELGKDTLARMEATLSLTEIMYTEGSGLVKKTDYLDNKVMVGSIRAMVALLEKNELMARAALANTMGMSWNEAVIPADTRLPHVPFLENLDDLTATAYRFNPDWAKVEAGLQAAEGAVRTARSGYFPKLAVTGELFKYWNDYDAGLVTDRNRDGWNVSLGVEIPLFNGFLTRGKVDEARARVSKIKEEKILLEEGIGLQVKDTFLSLSAARKAYEATLEAMTASIESRDLSTRAYQNELVETEDVITAQLIEALMSAQHYKARYEHLALLSRLELIVGSRVLDTIGN